ncbi:FKBP-type peptidyl-prolyl cis-trans isomerase [Maribacter sp. 4G9]|uniref:FKBP-type peptidyl-prolyl cis-trans isomerase n=1 Tax=Maribacter sp. 4G9 TaxID=1889777 RepID=UPI000C14C3A9|nr:FKBP-type peptidyl-prolyl cis-trans isomerase [Maribacter sp. 4G9]PIB38921.1 hypothetical protein BFP75_13980 [Maribacter sp. 4G9]
MKLKNIVIITIVFGTIWSCRKDDDPIGEVVPPRSIIEVAAEDDAEIREFLSTHFFNYEDFQDPPEGFDFKIQFDTISGENEDKTSILDSGSLPGIEFGMETITIPSAAFRITDGEEAEHTLYYLIARQGVSEETPTIGDDVALRYEGLLLNGTIFDNSGSQPLLLNLTAGDGRGLTIGFGNGVEYLKTGIDFIDNGDGTVSYSDYGIGAIFIPSGLAYFNGSPSSLIPTYSPLIFKIDALAYQKDTDFDGDGIPSILEDVDGDGNLNNDNTDGDILANFNDTDDDGDGIPTREEIILDDEGNFVGFKDTDGDGIPDHLDRDS